VPKEVDPIDVIEAAYDLDGDDREWLTKLATTVRPFLDGGHGLITYIFDPARSIEDAHRDALVFDVVREHIPNARLWVANNPQFVESIHTNDGLVAMLELCKRAGLKDLRAEMPVMMDYYDRVGVKDYVALQSIEPGGTCVVMAAGQSKPRTFDARTRRLWSRINVHIGAGRRLRAAMRNDAAPEEAILTPTGKLEHAEGEGTTNTARTALREAVARVERARGKQRRSEPERATEAWSALVQGRWSLVDRFERGGRRYIVARRNEHALPDPRALTPRQRAIVHLASLGKSNKLIGYELGLAESTVGSHLSHAMRKLGAATRVDLIRLVMGLSQRR
jgi:DNA-binding CsgD family transcriptional regulator